MENMKKVLLNILAELTGKEVVKKIKKDFDLKTTNNNIKVSYDEKTDTYSVKVSGVKSRSEIESMVFRILMINK